MYVFHYIYIQVIHVYKTISTHFPCPGAPEESHAQVPSSASVSLWLSTMRPCARHGHCDNGDPLSISGASGIV